MDPDPRPFFVKFDSVNRESWTGQKLDVTTWEDEAIFAVWLVRIVKFVDLAGARPAWWWSSRWAS